ncbi:dehydratase [Streptomyces sp. uw30]|uniref:MaoC/PaaZ C-terminal domain-containing protein n=1 Tax=Streptomyces sp. uw30 TaxID=1828179 RepID=UPI0011CDE3B3|nr:MaoC/PaaZ C-terminal domain-containing protein [Streptomyces sp. uw30]TXS46420.1 dehydratase [Streptomyces sp. uw30]
MAAKVAHDDIEVGTEIPAQDITVRRIDLLRYCGACSDFTATHWNERIAKSVGLPDVIVHGTYTIAAAVRVVTDWVGDPSALIEYSVRRFTRPVAVPDDDAGATMRITGVVERKLDDRRAVIRLRARFEGLEVMSGARAVVRLA